MMGSRPATTLLSLIALVGIMLGSVSPAFSSDCVSGHLCNDVTPAVSLLAPNPKPFLANGDDCPTSFEERVILLINVERANAGVPPLTLDIRLQDAARWFAEDVANNGVQIPIDHDSRGFSKEYRVLTERGYDFDWLEETISLGSGADNGADTPEEVVGGWMVSHSSVLLSPSAEHIGVGYADYLGPIWDDVTIADFASPIEPGESREPPLATCDPGFYQMHFPVVKK